MTHHSKTTLHERLIANQDPKEITRKRDKAKRNGWWTQEDIDHIHHGHSDIVNKFMEVLNGN